ncbi:MAG: glycosyltransferase [Chitinispirillia bacterium]|nr:glycosyltransferase [Chitinispirillia bacterium]MCL2241879.1 glycosyltransferase [Chitinispirillia bacterium]
MAADKNSDILISIVIVNYKVPQCLIEALHSIRLAKYSDRSEVIIIDNASGDNSREIVTSQFGEVQWIQLKTNIGFGKACNIGVEAAHGRYLLLLNPDTVISPNTLSDAVEFMESHPQAGLMGPKILNPDGTLQLSCRRSVPTPSVAFYYFAGLSHLFPRSRRFGRYHLTYMDENETAQVPVISGSFMFMKRELFNEIGGFDKRFFMYGEDIDLCYRISKTGHEVWYCPEIKIVHRKGKSSSKRRLRSRVDFYEAMIIFSHKYRGEQKTFFPWWLMWVGVVFQAVLNIGSIIMRSLAAILLDAGVINLAVWAELSQRISPQLVSAWRSGASTEQFFAAFGPGQLSLYTKESMLPLMGMHAAITVIVIFLFLYNGIYSSRQYSVKNLFFSWALASALVLSGLYFLTDYGMAGLMDYGTALAITVLAAIFWREALPPVFKSLKRLVVPPERAVIVGHGDEVTQYIKDVDSRRNSPKITGVVLIEQGENQLAKPQGQIEGYPILGSNITLAQTLSSNKADVLLIAASRPRYSEIINILVQHRNKGIEIRWEAME